MTTVILSLVLSGSCHQSACQAVQQVAVAQVAYPYYPVEPYWYVAGRESLVEQRLNKLEQILEQQVQINQRLTQGVSAEVSQVTSQAKAIIQYKCIKCHQGDGAKGGFRLDVELTVGDKLLVADKVETGEMPPKPAKELSDDDFQVLRAWANEDKAAVRALLKGK